VSGARYEEPDRTYPFGINFGGGLEAIGMTAAALAVIPKNRLYETSTSSAA
jgi:hypothetical protein